MRDLDKKDDLAITKQIAARLLTMPPKPHDEMKVGKATPRSDAKAKRPSGKGARAPKA